MCWERTVAHIIGNTPSSVSIRTLREKRAAALQLLNTTLWRTTQFLLIFWPLHSFHTNALKWVFLLFPNFSTCFYCSWQNCMDISHLYEKWHFPYLYMRKSSFQLLGNYLLHTLGIENHSLQHGWTFATARYLNYGLYQYTKDLLKLFFRTKNVLPIDKHPPKPSTHSKIWEAHSNLFIRELNFQYSTDVSNLSNNINDSM